MGVARDLLQQAIHLATYQGVNVSQVDLRRAISTAYYAIFHLLVEDGGQRWRGGSSASVTGLERALDHSAMRNSSQRFSGTNWSDWRGSDQPVPPLLRRVAKSFLVLQDARLLADYDNQQQWSITDVEELLSTAEAAFQDWDSIRTDPLAGNYLLSMLLGKRR